MVTQSSRYAISALSILFFIGFANSIFAATVNVAATASGGFGSQGNPGSTAFILGHTFSNIDEMVSITATGTINLSAGATGVTPQGINTPAGTPFALTTSYTPLEEVMVDSGVLTIPRPVGDMIEDVGALIGVYIPATTNNNPTFTPFDEDLVPLGIPASDLFLIGLGTTFTAQGPGALYLGINEWYAQNNSGAFQVTLDPVPIPAAAWLFISGILGLFGIKYTNKLIN